MYKSLIFFFLSFLILVTANAQVNPNNHYVQGYHRSDGTYVKGHYRTNPNHTNRDNYTTRPNVNPYTGKKGYIKPDNNYIPSYNYSIPTYNYSTTYDYSKLKSTNTSDVYSSFDYSNNTVIPKIDYPDFSNNFSYENKAVSYHDRYSLSDKKLIEQFLKNNDFNPGSADGIFTNQTIEAIKSLQRFIGVTADGRFGPNTMDRVTQLLN